MVISSIGKQQKGDQCNDTKMGKVCKICDRKFFMWSTYNMYQDQMENQQTALLENQVYATQIKVELQNEKLLNKQMQEEYKEKEDQFCKNKIDYTQ